MTMDKNLLPPSKGNIQKYEAVLETTLIPCDVGLLYILPIAMIYALASNCLFFCSARASVTTQ